MRLQRTGVTIIGGDCDIADRRIDTLGNMFASSPLLHRIICLASVRRLWLTASFDGELDGRMDECE